MIEIVAYLDGQGSAPSYLRYSWVTEKYGNPYSGGWMDWPAGEIQKIDYCSLVYKTLSQYQRDGVLPNSEEDAARYEIVEDYMLLDQYNRTGVIPDNEFSERVQEFAELLND